MSQCPGPESMAVFLEGGGSARSRERILRHVAECDGCHEILTESIAWHHEASPRPTHAGPRTSKYRHAAAAAALVAIAVIPVALLVGPGDDTPRAALAHELAAYEAPRPTLARITGGFEYGPPPERLRSRTSEATDRSRPLALYGLAAEIEALAEADPTAERLSDLGIAYLVLGETDDAVEKLERARTLAPDDASLANDLGAAYLHRATTQDRRDDIVAAHAAFSRAVDLDPTLGEARFNKALAIESLGLLATTAEAWTDYVATGDTSEWGREASRRLQEARALPLQPAVTTLRDLDRTIDQGQPVVSRAVHRDPGTFRVLVQSELLRRWATEHLEGRAAEHELARAETIATAYGQATGDAVLTRVVAEIRHALASNHDRATRLANGWRHYGHARSRIMKQGPTPEVEADFDRALVDFRAASSEARLWAEAWSLVCKMYGGLPLDELRTSYDRLLDDALEVGSPALETRILWNRGLALASHDLPAASLGDLVEALELAERTGELESIAYLHSLVREGFWLLGNQTRAWRHGVEALQLLPRTGFTDRMRRVIGGTVPHAIGQGRLELARLLVSELELSSDLLDSEAHRLETALTRAELDHALGHDRAALETLDQLASLDLHPRIRAEITRRRGRILVTIDPDRAITELDAARELYREAGLASHDAAILTDIGEAHHRAKRVDLARESLEEALALLERRGRRALETGHWPVGIETSWRAIELVAALDDTRDAAAAWARDERVRVLLRPGGYRAGSGTPSPVTLDELASRLRPDEIVATFGERNGLLVARTVSSQGLTEAELEIAPDEVLELSERLSASIRDGRWSSVGVEAAGQLHRLLIGPLRLDATARSLVIVPHRAMASVSFGALVDPTTGRFLVESLTLTTAPSATAFAWARDSLGAKPGPPRSALVVGDPAVDPTAFPDLPELPSARDEASAVGALYPAATVLVGANASATNFLDLARKHDVIHVGAHGIANVSSPSRSALVLAPSHGDPDRGVVFASSLLKTPLPNARMVLLATCESAQGSTGDSTGPSGLAAAFLAASVPSVVATLWPIDDMASTRLATELHRGLTSGLEPSAALRQAQVEMIRSSDPALNAPAAWAGFVALGG